MRNPLFRLLAPSAAVSALLLFGACGVGFNENTGGDGSRDKAQELQLDKSYDDRIDADEGDHTDWKKFTLEQDYRIELKIFWDKPGVKAVVTLRDERGEKLATLKHAKGEKTESLGPMKLKEGAYFLEFAAKEGASVYTFEVAIKSAELVPDL